MKQIMREISSGVVKEKIVLCVSDGGRMPKDFEKTPRFDNDEDRKAHSHKISQKLFIHIVNSTFTPRSLYSTLTLNDKHEVHTYLEAYRIAYNLRSRLRRRNPDAQIIIVIGGSKSSHRIHFHMVSNGLSKEQIENAWGELGGINRIDQLREHNVYDGKDCGADYTGLAKYLHNHWTPEKNGRDWGKGCRRWLQTANIKRPEISEPQEVDAKVPYTVKRPPKAPRGYKRVEARATEYGYLYFKYVVDADKLKGKKRRE